MRWRVASVVMLLVGTALEAPAGDLRIGSGSNLDLGSSRLNLACGDLTVFGDFAVGTVGLISVGDVSIESTGVLDAESATLEIANDWNNAGTFLAGTSTLRFVDGCSATGAILSGDSVFADIEFLSPTGKSYFFTAGSTQTVTGDLTLQGASGSLLNLRSTLASVSAFMDALGANIASYVDVDDIDATGGNSIFVGEESVLGANTPGWALVPDIPLLPTVGLFVLVLGLLWTGAHQTSRR
ncbi:MAG: hypothetical protein VB934_13225 [Polyangiaceae bacterium]